MNGCTLDKQKCLNEIEKERDKENDTKWSIATWQQKTKQNLKKQEHFWKKVRERNQTEIKRGFYVLTSEQPLRSINAQY
jgi:hypothetical protein